jgi:hypothetical protein
MITTACRFVVAPNFHLDTALTERLSAAEGADLSGLAPATATRAEMGDCVCLFVLPGHLCSSFWGMLECAQQAGGAPIDFDGFAAAVRGFLAFKELPPPKEATFELVLRQPEGEVDADRLWAVVNLSDVAAVLEVPGASLRLGPREGCRCPDGLPVRVLPPESEGPEVLLVIRRPMS